MSKEIHPCFHCNEGKIEIYIPDTYTGYPHGLRAVCQKSTCRRAESELYDSETKRFQDQTNRDQKKNQERKETKNKLAEEYQNSLKQKINQAFTCRGSCGKVINLNEEAYNWKGETGYYCKPCITAKITAAYDEIDQKYSTSSSQSVTNCSKCQQNIPVGTNCYSLPNNPNKKYCENCKEEMELCLIYLDGIEKGMDLTERIKNSPKLSSEAKINLTTAQQIKQGQPVNIDNLPIDQEDKVFLKEFQRKNSSNYRVECQNCQKNYQTTAVPPNCQHCRSRQIKVWQNGSLQTLPAEETTKPKKMMKSLLMS